jgi:hypothetical protein
MQEGDNAVTFCIQRNGEYPEFTKKKAVHLLKPLAMTYLHEARLSSLVTLKYKYRGRMNAESNLTLKQTISHQTQTNFI